MKTIVKASILALIIVVVFGGPKLLAQNKNEEVKIKNFSGV